MAINKVLYLSMYLCKQKPYPVKFTRTCAPHNSLAFLLEGPSTVFADKLPRGAMETFSGLDFTKSIKATGSTGTGAITSLQERANAATSLVT